jgi:hypothetical protein
MYNIRLEHQGAVLRFNTDTREGAYLLFTAMRAAYPLHSLTVWYGGALLEDFRAPR